MIKPITNHIHPVTVEELETIHAHVNGTFTPSSIAKEREAYTSGQEASANLFELVAASMPERSTNVLCNIDLSAPIEQLQAEIAALRSWAYGNDETAHQPADMIKAPAKFIIKCAGCGEEHQSGEHGCGCPAAQTADDLIKGAHR